MRHNALPPVTRREALCRIGSGFGMMAFASLVSRTALAADLAQTSKAAALSGGLHHPAKASIPKPLPMRQSASRRVTGWADL